MTSPAAPTTIGIIKRVQGLRGHVLARLQYEIATLPVETLFLQIEHTLVPYKVEHCVCQHKRAILKLQGVDNVAAAHALKGYPILVPQEALEQCTDQLASLVALQGYQVVDAHQGHLGTVQDVYERPLQPLLVVDHAEGELLIPYHEDVVTHIDHSQQSLHTVLPAGFLQK